MTNTGSDREKRGRIQGSETCSVLKMHGHNTPVDVHEVHGKQPKRARHEERLGALGSPRHEEEERNHEMADHQRFADRRPGALGSMHEIGGLLGDVPVPDEEVLAERDVGPEDREGEEELPEVLEVLDRDHAAKPAA